MDVLVMLLTTVLIALTNIAIGVGVGFAASCAAYAWDAAAGLGVRYYLDPDPVTGELTKIYEVQPNICIHATMIRIPDAHFTRCCKPRRALLPGPRSRDGRTHKDLRG